MVSGVKGSLELVNVYGVALCVWFVLFVVLLGFGGCGVVVWCQWVVLWSCWSLVLKLPALSVDLDASVSRNAALRSCGL